MYNYWTNTAGTAPAARTGKGAFTYSNTYQYIKLDSNIAPPVITPGAANRINESTGYVKFTSNDPGAYYYERAAKGAEAPTINTSGAGTAFTTTAEQTISLTGLVTAEYDVYVVVKCTAGLVGNTLKFEVPAIKLPELTAGAVSRTSDTNATVKFTSDTAGHYYYAVVDSGAAAPDIDTAGEGTACGTSEVTISLTELTAGAKDIYIVVKDASGNMSAALKIEIARVDTGAPDPADGLLVRAAGAHSQTAFINLTQEIIVLPPGYTVAAFSVDGGTKWRRGALPAANRFPKMLDKGMTLHLTNAWDQKEKKPGEGAVTVTFPEIGARPKRNADRLAPFYGDADWGLAPRGSTEWSAVVSQNLEYAPSSNGRAPNDGVWLQVPQGGIPIAASGKATFLVRTAPASTTAASAAWRVRPANFGKAPNYKIRQVKDGDARIPSLAFRKGDQYAFGTGDDPVLAFIPPLGDKAAHTVADLRTQAQAPAADAVDIYIRRASTGRRPPTLMQKIPLAAPPPAASPAP
jgi:hypothetical protein